MTGTPSTRPTKTQTPRPPSQPPLQLNALSDPRRRSRRTRAPPGSPRAPPAWRPARSPGRCGSPGRPAGGSRSYRPPEKILLSAPGTTNGTCWEDGNGVCFFCLVSEKEGALVRWFGRVTNPNRTPVNIRFNPTPKIGSKMDGEFTYPKMASLWF